MDASFERSNGNTRRHQRGDRRLRVIENPSHNSVFRSIEEVDDTLAYEVDALNGQPLRRMEMSSGLQGRATTGRRWIWVSVSVVSTALFVAILLTVSLSVTKSKTTSSEPNATTPSTEPETTLERYHRLFSVILGLNVTDRNRLEDENDATAKALYWMSVTKFAPEDIGTVRSRYSLSTLYFSTHGKESDSNWIRESNWMTSESVCTWYGVECTPVGDALEVPERVRSLNVTSNMLSGTIPPEIALLQQDIHSLDLSSNLLGGTMPDFSTLANLKELFVGHNELSSSIPDSIYRLTSLLRLKANDCLLTGSISSEIALLSSLRGLELQNNILSKTLPNSVARMHQLRTLYLDGNELSGTIPRWLPPNLLDLRLSRNKLVGRITAELSTSQQLRVLHLDGNDLTGT
jgi:Leucine-rich repeat (LRR) protein